MSSSASPSGAPSAEYADHLSNLVAIPSQSHENHYFLGPVGNPDPTEFIIGEINRIPFRLTNPDLGHWKNTFKSWPSLEKVPPKKSCTTWFKRVSASKRVHWDEIGIGQALDLTIANSAKDEPLMVAASYFWPMTPTLIDISMIMGLDVTSSANPMSLNTKNQYDFKTKSIGGWSSYVAAYMGQGSVTPREHVAFLLMWLEQFLFYGSSCGPTTNWQFLAEALETKIQFPLGKILLGYLYQMLNNASAKIAVGSVVGAGRPWWLLQTWLNLIVMKVVNRPSVSEAEFPRLEPIVNDDGEELTHRRCTSYGEYASTPTDAGVKLSAELLKDWFYSFYESFQKDTRVWFLYEDSAELEHPLDFRFEDINHEIYQLSREIFSAAISPCILPVGIHQGRNIQSSYEFYHPISSARQLGMGQLPIDLFFANKIQCRGEISSTLMMDRLLNLQGPPMGSIDNIELATFRSKNFDRWWGEWKLHLFHQPASMYMTDLFPDVVPQTTESSPPHQSNSGRDIQYAPGLIPNRGGLSPPPPPPSEHQSSSDQTPSAVGSHHIEEEIQPAVPAIPVLADLFSFDIGDYLDEGEEDTTSKALAPLSDDVKKTLGKKSKLDQLSEGPIKSNIDRLEARKIDLLAQLEECNAELDMEHTKLADLPKSIEEQKARLKSAIKHVADLTKSLKVIPRTDAQDAQAIEEVEQIRQKAISAIQRYLSQ
uniref:Uncharacterized protein n=1 Tax=Oryza sativa subsp. japonica TaxID=39947 RepID=Q2QSA2_ORYSJ|nr:hypothetical protein LOC_Os12g24820 [Oryza sativa Japonica Group]